MKIISGIYKGRTLEGFNLLTTRPTMDRVKESLFAIINSCLDESVVLDLFAGSGNLGIEALSNGSKECYFVDNNKSAIRVIKNNLKNLKIETNKVFLMDYLEALKYFNKIEIKFKIIFLDPPYKMDIIKNIIKEIIDKNLLESKGLIICEVDNNNLEDVLGLKIIKNKRYGDKYIIIYQKEE